MAYAENVLRRRIRNVFASRSRDATRFQGGLRPGAPPFFNEDEARGPMAELTLSPPGVSNDIDEWARGIAALIKTPR